MVVGLGWAQTPSSDDDFFGDESPTLVETPVATGDPLKAFVESADGVNWGGTVTTDATWSGGWVDQHWKDGLSYDLETKLAIDARPDKNYRFRLALKTGYPFTDDTDNVTIASTPASTTTISVPNVKVWELFSDVTIADAVFLRFGKQSASWGVSYFYSPGDVISLTTKDVTDPTAEREGPVALKASIPFPAAKANLTGFVLARDSYFSNGTATLENLGYAVQGDILVGPAQIGLAGFYQESNAPKIVATLNTGLGYADLPVISDINFFTEGVLSYGSDVVKGVGSTTRTGFGTTYASLQDWSQEWYPTATAGLSYTNSDSNLTLRTEYLFNPFGSDDKDSATLAYNTAIYTLAGNSLSGASRQYTTSDAYYPGRHYLTSLVTFSELAGTDKLAFTTLWQQNLSDQSGWVKPYFTISPWDVLSFTVGMTVVYGQPGTQYPLQFQWYNSSGTAEGTQWAMFNLGITFGTGKY